MHVMVNHSCQADVVQNYLEGKPFAVLAMDFLKRFNRGKTHPDM